jgi:hypothetical protein
LLRRDRTVTGSFQRGGSMANDPHDVPRDNPTADRDDDVVGRANEGADVDEEFEENDDADELDDVEDVDEE